MIEPRSSPFGLLSTAVPTHLLRARFWRGCAVSVPGLQKLPALGHAGRFWAASLKQLYQAFPVPVEEGSKAFHWLDTMSDQPLKESDLASVPANLPEPQDDGACDHLSGSTMPSVPLQSTDGRTIDISTEIGVVVAYFYPMTGRPGLPLPAGWDHIPGARGCSPQACAYRDHYAELTALGVSAVYGISTQDTGYQAEAQERLHLSFPLLSDSSLQLTQALKLPTFKVPEVGELTKRLTLIIRDGRIVECFYPVFPSDSDTGKILTFLKARTA